MDDETPSTMNNNDENSNESYKNILSERLQISDYFENIITKLSQKKWKEKLNQQQRLLSLQ